MRATTGIFLGLVLGAANLLAAPSGPVQVGVTGDPNNLTTRGYYRILKETSGARGIQLEWSAVAAGHAEVTLMTSAETDKLPAGPLVTLAEPGTPAKRSKDAGRRVATLAAPKDLDGWFLDSFQDELFAALAWAAGRNPAEMPKLEYREAKIPNYEKITPAPVAQEPLPAEQSMKLAQVPPGFELQLFASEPMVINPIALNWDERGRLWVIETVDYPNNLHAGKLGNDRIKILTDTDGDGRADKSVTFADGLSIPSSIVFANGGALVTNGSDMLFLKDTNGDDKADVRQVLFTGFGMGDTHAGPSNMLYGFDGQIWGTVGYSGFTGKVGGAQTNFGSGVFRFRPDGSKIQFLQPTTNNTWGLGVSEHGEIMGSTANSNPSWFLSVPVHFYESVSMEGAQTPRAENDATFYPITRDVRQVDAWRGPLRETGAGRTTPTSRNFTAAAGHAFYTDVAFPERFRNNAVFVTEPTGHLVATGMVQRDSADLHLHFTGENIFSSADAWSAPVVAEVGPDGAVWIADWYNLIIQHNPTPSVESAGMLAETGRGAAYVTPLRDVQHGRIYRILPTGAAKQSAAPALDPKNWQSLVAGLASPSLRTRMHAQRLLVETRPEAATEALLGLTKKDGPASLHALWALTQLLPAAELVSKLGEWSQDPRPLIRRAAAQAGAPRLSAADLLAWLNRETDAMALKEVILAIALLPETEELGKQLQAFHAKNKTALKGIALREAFRIAAARHWWGFLAGMRASSEVLIPGQKPDLLKDIAAKDKIETWNVKLYNPQNPPAGDPAIAIVKEGREGGECLKLSSKDGVDLMVSLPFVTKPGMRYRLTGWVKTENVQPVGDTGEGAELSVRGPWSISRSLRGTRNWTHLQVEFDSGPGGDMLVGAHLGYGGTVAGTAWFEDIQLRELDESGDESLFEALVRQVMLLGKQSERVTALAAANDPVSQYVMGSVAQKLGAVKKPAVFTREVAESRVRGEAIYAKVCTACHQANGKGLAPDFPPLAASEWVAGKPEAMVLPIIHGLAGEIQVAGAKFNGIMPPNPTFSDADIADVATFIRTSFGNAAPAITVAEVKAIRATHSARKDMWQANELKDFLPRE